MARICEFEDQVFEWYDRKYYHGQPPIDELDLTELKKFFQIHSFEAAGLDYVIYKLELIAEREGKLKLVD